MVENLVFWSWFLSISVYFTAPCNGVEYSADAEFLPLAISKSGAGQLDLLILEANALHGVVSLSYITCHQRIQIC